MLRICLAATLCCLPQDSLRDLDAADPIVARRAFEAAIRAGDESALEAAAKTSDRARLALAEVRAHKKFGDAYPTVRTFTLKFEDKPLEEGLRELARVLGLPLGNRNRFPGGKVGGTPDRFSLELKDAYLLEAVRLCSEASKTYLWLQGGELHHSPFPTPPTNAVYWRNFAVSPSYVHEARVVTAAGTTRTVTLQLHLSHDGAPRICGIKGIRLLEAKEDTGRSIVPEQQEPRGWPGDVVDGTLYPVDIRLAELSPAARKLSIRGFLDLFLPCDPAFVDVPLTAEGRETTLDWATVRITHQAPEVLQIVSKLRDPQKQHIRPRASDFQIVPADGPAASLIATLSGPPNAPQQEWKAALPAGLKEASVRIRTFKSWAELAVPFEFKDLAIR